LDRFDPVLGALVQDLRGNWEGTSTLSPNVTGTGALTPEAAERNAAVGKMLMELAFGASAGPGTVASAQEAAKGQEQIPQLLWGEAAGAPRELEGWERGLAALGGIPFLGMLAKGAGQSERFFSKLGGWAKKPGRFPKEAPAEEFSNILMSGVKKGEFKPEELEWNAVSGLLKDRVGEKLTREDVIDAIDLGGVKVEEKVYSSRGYEDKQRLLEEQANLRNELRGLEYPLFNVGLGRAVVERLTGRPLRPDESHIVRLREYVHEQRAQGNSFTLADYGRYRDQYRRDLEARGESYIDNTRAEEIRTRLSETYQELGELEQNKTRWSQYSLPGDEPGSYRELIMTLDRPPGKNREAMFAEADRINAEISAVGGGRTWDDLTEAERREADRLVDEAAQIHEIIRYEGQESFTHEGHWPNVENPLLHVRFGERYIDGKRTLFVHEMQSDWHQQGAKAGYQEAKPYVRGMGEWQEDIQPVPNAPFKKSWPELGMKRMLIWAKENGYERIAWPGTPAQMERIEGHSKEGLRRWYNEVMPNTMNKLMKPYGGKVQRTSGADADNLETMKIRLAHYFMEQHGDSIEDAARGINEMSPGEIEFHYTRAGLAAPEKGQVNYIDLPEATPRSWPLFIGAPMIGIAQPRTAEQGEYDPALGGVLIGASQ